MIAISLYYFSRAISATIYLVLAVYTGLARTSRSIQYPFVAYCLIATFEALASYLSADWLPSASVPWVLRARWMAAFFVPALFLHMFAHLQTGLARFWAGVTTMTAYTMAFLTAVIIGSSGFLVATRPNLSGGPLIVEPVFSPSGRFFVETWSAAALIAASVFLLRAAYRSERRRLQSDARRLLLPWLILMFGSAISIMGIAQIQVGPAAQLWLAILQQWISVAAGALLALGIIRFGSPFGHPIKRRMAPLLIFLIALIGIEFLSSSVTEVTRIRFVVFHLLVPALVTGFVMARPESLESMARWIGRASGDHGDFSARLNRAWGSLIAGDFGIQQISELLLGLERDLQAEYVGLLEKAPSSEPGRMAFGDSFDGPRIVLPSDPIDWPLREGDPAMAALQVRGLPGLPSLLMPIVAEGEFVGLLIIGEPIRGGEFSDADTAQAEALRQLISSALTKGVRLSSPPLSLHGGEDSLVPVGSSLAICAFGHLRVLVRREERMQPLRLPSRARQILAMLLIRYPEAISSQEIMACLWPESDPESAANNLYVAIYTLRRALQPSLRRGQESRFIERQQDRYRLRYGHGIWADCVAFQQAYRRAVASAERGDAKAACNAFEQALRLISAPFLDDASLDLPSEVEVARARFNRMAREAARHVVDISLEEGSWRRAEQALQRVLALNPEDRETRSQLIRLYRQQGMHQLAIQFLRSPAHD